MKTVLTMALAAMVMATAGPAANATTAQGARDVVRDCHHAVDFNLIISSARNMRCRAARRDMRRYRGSIGFRFTTPGGFHCKRVSGTRLGGQWRCVRRSKAYRFEFGD